jgi:hypothetical protein
MLSLSCGGKTFLMGGIKPVASSASVTLTMSDPVVCNVVQGGPFQHIYVTISDVQAYTSASQLQNGVDLTPNLSQNPMQVDLLGRPGSGCTLATLGNSAAVAPGAYRAMRVFLAGTDQVSKIAGGTKCPNTSSGPAANCAVLANQTAIYLDPANTGSSPFAANLLSGPISISSGAQTINIDFDSCASMMVVAAGNYGLNPAMHAALMATPGSIAGKVVDASSLQPISGNVIVALEAIDSNGVDREIMQTAPASDGSFVLCPVPAATYDIVATAISSTHVAYAATVVSGVQPNNSVGTVPLQSETGMNSMPAVIAGQVTIASPSGVSGFSQVSVSALQKVTVQGASVLITVPLPSIYASSLSTAATAFANYSMNVAAENPWIGVFVPNGQISYQQGTSAVSYTVNVLSSCNPAAGQKVVNVSSGQTSTAPTIALTGCPSA